MTQGHMIAATPVITTTAEVDATGVMTIAVGVVVVVEGTTTGTEIMTATATVVNAIVSVATGETGMMTGGINNLVATRIRWNKHLGWSSKPRDRISPMLLVSGLMYLLTVSIL